MEILDKVIEKLMGLENAPLFKEIIFPIRRLVEQEKCRQLKEGARIKVSPLFYSCEFCVERTDNPEKFFRHQLEKHICAPDDIRKVIDEQQENYHKEISDLEDLTNKYTEVMLDVDYTDKIRDT